MCSTMGLWCGNKKNTHSVRNICSRSYGSSFWRIIGFIASLAAAACFEIAWNISSSGIGTGKTRKQCERWVEARRSKGNSQVRSVRFGFSGVRILFSIYRLRLVPKSTVQPPRTKMYDLDYVLTEARMSSPRCRSWVICCTLVSPCLCAEARWNRWGAICYFLRHRKPNSTMLSRLLQ